MASTGFLADFSRKPPLVKLGAFFLVLAVLVGGWYQLAYSKIRKDIKAAQAQAVSLTASEIQLGKDEAEYKRLDEEQKKLKKIIADNDNALPTAAQLPAVFEMLNRKLAEAGVEVGKWDYQKEVPVDETIYKVPVAIEMQGTFYQLEKFFYLLYKVNQKEGDESATPAPGADTAERDRILTVEDLHLYSPVVENGELVLTASFRASTFRKEEPVVDQAATDAKDAKDKKAADKAKKNAAGGGLTGQPDKAKAKTEDAMKKDEDRAQGGPAGSGDEAGTGADRLKGGL
jgi:Tfp pilus assembly protein PilO